MGDGISDLAARNEGGCGVSVRDDLTRQLAGTITDQREVLLMNTARLVAGDAVPAYEIARRSALVRYPDGTEVFVFDGLPLLKLWPVQVESSFDGTAHKMKVCQQYQRLDESP